VSAQDSSQTTFRDALSNAIRYWEPRRLVYNLVLLLVVAAAFVARLPESLHVMRVDIILALFILAVLANILYCAAYVPDIALQFSSFRSAWLRYRWLLLALGTLFASAIAFLCIAGPFGIVDGFWD
jgi:hypothetical protein